ncbi:MAG: hypothetical protein ACREDR_27510, partial [Blastocatellia bacterium]
RISRSSVPCGSSIRLLSIIHPFHFDKYDTGLVVEAQGEIGLNFWDGSVKSCAPGRTGSSEN